MRRLALATCAALAVACGRPDARFADRPIVWRVDDDRPVEGELEGRDFYRITYLIDGIVMRRSTRALELPDLEPAHNTNALDELPDSSWWNNRIGVRHVTPEEAATGAGAAGPPVLPLTITAGKTHGAKPGFFAKDAKGRKFLIKFDSQNAPGLESATSVVVNRIFWTLGYNVPNDSLVYFRREDLRVAPDATVENELKEEEPFSEQLLQKILRASPRLADGRIRASASEFLKGKPLGGIAMEGVRADDPNDTIPHEHRRELRALRVFGAWVNHADIKEDNTISMLVEQNGKRFVRHYLLDFGGAMGSIAGEDGKFEDGYEEGWDWEMNTRALVSFGLWQRPWEPIRDTPWVDVGPFTARYFDPPEWRPTHPYFPFYELDAADAYWGAKLVMRFDRKLLRAIVATGEYADPQAERYLVDTLLARRNAIGRAWLETVTPLDDFHIRGGYVCMYDLGVRYGLATSGRVQALDSESEVANEFTVEPGGRVCIPLPKHSRYSVYRLRTARLRERHPTMQLHVRGGRKPRVFGVVRVEP